MNAASGLSPTSAVSAGYALLSPSLTTSESSKEPNSMAAGYECEANGCKQIIYHKTASARILCKRHEVEDRFRNATAQKTAVAMKTVPVPKPFRKDKLYKFKPDDDMKPLLKRKRVSSCRRSTSHNDNDELEQSSPQKPPQQGTRSSLMHHALLAKPLSKRTHQHKAKSVNFLASMEGDQSSIEEDIAQSLGSASMAESPIEPATIDWDANGHM